MNTTFTHLRIRAGFPLGLCVLLGLGLAGCAGRTHQENVNAAEHRWRSVRSAVTLDMAQTQFNAGQLKTARRSVEEGLSLDPTNARLLTLAGRIEMEKGKLEKSSKLFEAAIANDDDLPDPHYYHGVVLQRWQKFEEAYEAYKGAYERAGDSPEYLVAMSDMLVSMDRTDEAVKLLLGKLAYFDQNAGIRTALGQLYRMKDMPVKSAAMFRQASLLDPDNQGLKEQLAMARIAAGKYVMAIQTLQERLRGKKHSYRPGLWRALAGAQVKAGRIADGRQTYFDLSRQTNNAEDWIRLAELSWRQSDLGGTLHAANRAIRLAPDRYESFLLVGMVWQARNKPEQALELFDKAAQRAPDNALPMILRGVTLQKAGKPTAAAHAYTRALQRDPQNHRAAQLLANVNQNLR